MPKWDDIKWALEEYEKGSDAGNTYQTTADLALSLEEVVEGDTVYDVGAGTGISTVAIVDQISGRNYMLGKESGPIQEKIYAVEPNQMISIARHKFGQKPLFESHDSGTIESQFGFIVDQKYLNYLMTTRMKMSRFSDSVKFIKKPAEDIGKMAAEGKIPKADKIYCLSAFKELVSDQEGNASDEKIGNCLRSIHDTLNKEGSFIFNLGGQEFDFGEVVFDCYHFDEFDEKRMADIDMFKSEFHQKFMNILNDRIRFRYSYETGETPYFFSVEKLEGLLENNGFALKRLEKTRLYSPSYIGLRAYSFVVPDQKYMATVIPRRHEDLKRWIVGYGNMRYFKNELDTLPNKEKTSLLEECFFEASMRYHDKMDSPHGETMATFVAKNI